MIRQTIGWSVKGKKRIAGLITGVVLAVCLTGCGNGISGTPELRLPAAESLQGMAVEQRDMERRKVVQGILVGEASTYSFREQKSNLEYKVNIGDNVKKGQVLAVAGGRELEARLEDLQQELEGVKADLAYQKSYGEINREILTLKQQYASESEQAAAVNAVNRGDVDQAYQEQLLALQISCLNQEIGSVKEELEQNTLYAETDGDVSFVNYLPEVQAFDTVIVVTDTSSVYVSLAEELSDKEEYRRVYTIKDGKRIELLEYPYTEEEKEMAKRNAMVLTARFKMEDAGLSIGDRIPVYIIFEEQKNVLTVPRSCVYQGGGEPYVYLINGKSKEKCFVEIGMENNTDIQIVSGAEEGDMVYYPVDTTVKYEGTQKVELGPVSLCAVKKQCNRYYPAFYSVGTGVGRSKLAYITDKDYLEKGDVIARITPSAGKADVQETENQIRSLDNQYAAQKAAHEETIRILNQEIAVLQGKTTKASVGKEQESFGDKSSEKEAEKEEEPAAGQSTEKPIESDTEAGPGTEEETGTEPTTEDEGGKDKPPGQDKPTEPETVYPAAVQLRLKGLELSMEQLSHKYDEENYGRQHRRLEKRLAEQKKKTGEITITAEEEGAFIGYYGQEQEGRVLEANEIIGMLQKTSIAYLQADNVDNGLEYGNTVTVQDMEGNTYQGTVAGAYHSGEIKDTGSDEDGNSWTNIIGANDNQKSAYIMLSGEDIVEKGNVIYYANEIKNAIAVDRTLVKSENNQYYTWILREGKPCKQYVEYIAAADEKLWILNGLTEGDTLLTGVK